MPGDPPDDAPGRDARPRCCVKNCQKVIEGDPIEIDGKLYCGTCGVAVLKSRFGFLDGAV